MTAEAPVNGGMHLSDSEMQLLMQMISSLNQTTLHGFERMDRKLEQMVPRPEFTAFQDAVDLRFRMLEKDLNDAAAQHPVIEQKISNVEVAAAATAKEVRAETQAVAVTVAAAETKRLEEFKSLTTKFWWLLGGGVLTVSTGVLTAVLSRMSGG